MKTAYGTLGGVHQASAVTCDEFKSASDNYTNPTRYLYRENCVDWDNPALLQVTGQANTFKNPAPQVIGSAARMTETCNGIATTMYDTGVIAAYNSQQVYASGVGRYGTCQNHANQFRTQHNYYQSNPYLSQISYLYIP
ncbi:MAG TPA: hypothetical protein VFH62_08425 [Dehalococcoidia bacterium]|nr:hypothetical protein [Dehalococcoidia bacterium]